MSESSTRWRSSLLRRARRESPFLLALAVGALVRVAVGLAFRPGFVHSDGPAYLRLVDHLYPPVSHPAGYGVLLRLVAELDRGVDAVTVVQHVLGLLTATVLYVLLRRWSVRPWVATLAVLPLLLDQMQLVLEHTVLSDVLFLLLLVLAVTVLAWSRPLRVWAAGVAGLLLGLVTLVRIVGEPTLLAAAVFCVLVAGSWRVRAARVLVLCVGFAIPLTAYASWFHQENGAWALTSASSRALYMRVTSFVDCAELSVPEYERTLCPPQPLGRRLEPSQYGWNYDERLPPLVLPPGVTRDEALHDFATSAIRQQPWAYARTVLRDVGLAFYPRRTDHFEYSSARKWSFETYRDGKGLGKAHKAYDLHGGAPPTVHQPWADLLVTYDAIVYLPGPLLLALLAVALAGLVGRRPQAVPGTRPLILLLVSLGLGLIVVPDLVAEFVWRYQLPAIMLVPPAAALAFTRLRSPRTAAAPAAGPRDEGSRGVDEWAGEHVDEGERPDGPEAAPTRGGQPGTTATPSTDCPKGGVTRRSMARVQGTTKRS